MRQVLMMIALFGFGSAGICYGENTAVASPAQAQASAPPKAGASAPTTHGSAPFEGISHPAAIIPKDSEKKYGFRIIVENDVFFGHDKDYTNGTRLEYTQRLENGDYYGISLSQLIFTPRTHTNGAVYGEHPYAGWLTAGGGYVFVGEQNSTALEFQLGTTGKASIAKDCQWFIHEVEHLQQWDGWHDQMPSEVTLQLSVRNDVRLDALEYRSSSGFQTDGLAYGRLEGGTVYVTGGAGVLYRFGYNLPPSMNDFTINGANYGISPFSGRTYDASSNSYYGVAGVFAKYVLRDLFLDGTAFHHFDTHVDKEPWVVDVYLGIGIRADDVDYFFGAVYRSPQFKTQTGYTVFGNLQVKWNF